jgi:XTP/dITP diphosphohydrolase
MLRIAPRVVLATGNAGKLREMREILKPWQVEVRPISDFTSESVEETGLSFVENAIIKARFASAVSDQAAIADDSGLEVDALRGAPGIYSARYAGEDADDEANNRRLLKELEDVAHADRTARYRCAIAYMRWPQDPAPVICQASWEGMIGTTPEGAGGFGYDPLFRPVGMSCSAAQLSPADKNATSHRARALRGLLAQLEPSAGPG